MTFEHEKDLNDTNIDSMNMNVANADDNLPCETSVSSEESLIANDTSNTQEISARKARKLALRNDAKRLLTKLSQTYPDIFPKAGDKKPVVLAIGLHKNLVNVIKEWGFDLAILRTALSWYTRQLRYQRAVVEAEFRINLDGSQAEPIQEAHKVLAKQKIQEIEAWLAQHHPEKLKSHSESVVRNKPVRHHNKRVKNEDAVPEQKNRQHHRSPSKTVKPVQQTQTAALPNSERSVKADMAKRMEDLMKKFNQH